MLTCILSYSQFGRILGPDNIMSTKLSFRSPCILSVNDNAILILAPVKNLGVFFEPSVALILHIGSVSSAFKISLE